ncbi:ZFPL1 family protein [Megaselia abdita]
MGLCKCPKRQVTNQFCYEHRVNVCENCMIENHPKCIVQSYLQWLKDSDYISNCTLCAKSLEDGDCVRLICYHVFHWECLNARQSALPPNSSSQYHTCPCCSQQIIPQSNLMSPVADVLRKRLTQANWVVSGGEPSSPASSATPTSSQVTRIHQSNIQADAGKYSSINGTSSSSSNNGQHSVLLMDAFNPPSSNEFSASSRRPLLPRQSPIGAVDRDDNKYQRRTPAEIFSRWSRRFYAPSSRPPWRRTWFLVTSGVVAFLFVIYLMAMWGRSTSSSVAEEWNNPNPVPNGGLHYE